MTFKQQTWIEILEKQARVYSDKEALIFLADGEHEDARLTFKDLAVRAQAIGAELQALGLSGKRALLLYQPGLEYVAAFFGCLYAGVAAVPAYPPRNNRMLPRLLAIVKDSGADIALTTSPIRGKMGTMIEQAPDLKDLKWLETDSVENTFAESWRNTQVTPDTLAFLQYTSGSTGIPKGVMLSHGNLNHNSFVIHEAFEMSSDAIGVIWLPPYHDMGLIGGILQPIFSGSTCVLMPPAAFLQRPFRWLQAISKYKGTVSGGPNFAYDYCVNKITAEQKETLDLSSWQVAFNGAEPIRTESLERFANAFKSCGYRSQAFYPCYGLAEATLLVSGGKVSENPVIQSFDKTALEQNKIKPVSADNENSRPLVG